MRSLGTVAVDLDGVLREIRGDAPLPGAANFLYDLRDRGYKVVVYTARKPLEAVRTWLDGIGAEEFAVTDSKPVAVAYVDDRALPFAGDYAATLDALERFHPWWEGERTGP